VGGRVGGGRVGGGEGRWRGGVRKGREREGGVGRREGRGGELVSPLFGETYAPGW